VSSYSNNSMTNYAFSPMTARYVRLYKPSGWLCTGQFRVGN
jgi:hypothetical protein